MIHLAIFASGNGTNAENIIRYFSGHSLIGVALVISNKPDAYVLQRAKHHHINTAVMASCAFPGIFVP
ncbi:MAG: formyltransferase family protein, partial [Bacteroidales bacterium]|nr:formyltransferase family protein [Bacteroidales bacterium]